MIKYSYQKLGALGKYDEALVTQYLNEAESMSRSNRKIAEKRLRQLTLSDLISIPEADTGRV